MEKEVEKMKKDEVVNKEAIKDDKKDEKVEKILEIKRKKRMKIIITSVVVVVLVVLISGITVYTLDATNKTFGGKVVEIISPKKEISEKEAVDKAVKRFKQMGEKDVKKDEMEVLKILRKGEYYYYISSAENSLEIRISDGEIVRENSVLVEE